MDTTESADDTTTPDGLAPVYETKFNQPGYFGLILVRIFHARLWQLLSVYNTATLLQDLTYGTADPLPTQYSYTLEIISYICLVISLVCLVLLLVTYLATK